jgi:hypothetical protein
MILRVKMFLLVMKKYEDLEVDGWIPLNSFYGIGWGLTGSSWLRIRPVANSCEYSNKPCFCRTVGIS